jgi:hypothetical protein
VNINFPFQNHFFDILHVIDSQVGG